MRIVIFIYGMVSYALGTASLLYLIGFLGNIVVPKSIDSPPEWRGGASGTDRSDPDRPLRLPAQPDGPSGIQGALDLHRAKLRRTQHLRAGHGPDAGVAVLAVATHPGVVWNVEHPVGKGLLQGLFWLGWLILFASTFMINHFDLFGLRQVYLRLKGTPYRPVPFVQVALYRFVRHPIMLGLLMGFWATPSMSLGHLLFAAATTAYVFLGILLEEHDTRQALGEDYEHYRRKTSMIVPLPRGKS
jgi:protein-S-isoprenylcysteine O-methyltransferase Ste14